MRLQADFPVADIIQSAVGGARFFHLNQSQIPPVSLSHLVQLKTNQWPKGRSQRRMKRIARWPRGALGSLKRIVFVPGSALGGHLCKWKLWFTYEIHTGDCKPVKQPPHRIPAYQCEVINQQLEELFAIWSSAVVLSRKHDRTYYIYIEYCTLKTVDKEEYHTTTSDRWCVRAFGWGSVCASGNWQMRVK